MHAPLPPGLTEDLLRASGVTAYGIIAPSSIEFSDEVRRLCEENRCGNYARTWACPPAVGTVEECRERCLRYDHALMFTTMVEVRDIANIEETLATRHDHEEVTRQVAELVREQCGDVLVLSTEACAICEHCAWPDAPCRHPDRMFPCVESHGILATDIAERHGIEFIGGNVVTWFSLVFYK